MININEVKVTQCNIRNLQRVKKMIDFVKDGGFFSKEYVAQYHQDESPSYNQLIKIKKMPDGDLYLHDGHHRAIAILMAGRKFIDSSEYECYDWPSYELFLEVNFKVGWVTPLDIRTEVRYPDVLPFKDAVMQLPEHDRENYIRKHKNAYCQPRKNLVFVQDLAKCILDDTC